MKRTSSARTPSLCPLAASLAIAFAGSLATIGADARPYLNRARVYDIAAPTPPPSGARGSTVVTNCNDGGPGSLRDAYFNAVNGEHIDLTQLSCSTITLTSGALTNSGTAENVFLAGPGRDDLTIDGGSSNRVFVHNGAGNLQLSAMSITRGSYIGPYGGGCIYSYGGVVANYVNISACSLASGGTDRAYGGAIYAKGGVTLFTVNITDSIALATYAHSNGGAVFATSAHIFSSTISGNTVANDSSHYARGGGVFVLTDFVIHDSTIADNTADNGAGILLVGDTEFPMQIINSTISGNHARGKGGGLYSKYGLLQVRNSTITANTAVFDSGAGVFLLSDTEIESAIIAGNTSQDGLQASDVGGRSEVVITGVNNLIVASTLPMPADTISADPMLGPLQDNGGQTPTHALLAGSPAIDQGLALGLLVDQRVFDEDVPGGYEREVGHGTDIGAFEFGSPDRILTDGFEA